MDIINISSQLKGLIRNTTENLDSCPLSPQLSEATYAPVTSKVIWETYYYLIYRQNDDSSYMKEHESHVNVSEIYSTTVSLLPFLSVL